MLTVSQLAPLKDRDPYLYETLTKIVSAVNSASQAAGVDSSTPSPAPTPIASINVQASNGWFDVVDHRPKRFAPRLVLFCRVRYDAVVQRTARLFSRREPQSLRPARKPDALLARLQPIHRLDGVSSAHIRLAAHRSRRRRRQRPNSAALEGKRRLPQRPPARRQRLRRQHRRPHHKIFDAVNFPLRAALQRRCEFATFQSRL